MIYVVFHRSGGFGTGENDMQAFYRDVYMFLYGSKPFEKKTRKDLGTLL